MPDGKSYKAIWAANWQEIVEDVLELCQNSSLTPEMFDSKALEWDAATFDGGDCAVYTTSSDATTKIVVRGRNVVGFAGDVNPPPLNLGVWVTGAE